MRSTMRSGIDQRRQGATRPAPAATPSVRGQPRSGEGRRSCSRARSWHVPGSCPMTTETHCGPLPYERPALRPPCNLARAQRADLSHLHAGVRLPPGCGAPHSSAINSGDWPSARLGWGNGGAISAEPHAIAPSRMITDFPDPPPPYVSGAKS